MVKQKMPKFHRRFGTKNELIATVNKYIEENAERRICIRWYLRGLPLRDAIRKVLADREVRKNNYAPSDRREEL